MKKIGVIVIILVLVLLPIVKADISHPIYKETIEDINPSSYQEEEQQEEKRLGIGTSSYYYGTGLIAKEENGDISYYHKDNLGSLRAITDKDGKVKESNTYFPYGEALDNSEETFTFTGKELDSSGLQYFGARYYDPSIGRFITVDPIKDGINYYAYANNNPMKYVDPSGTQVYETTWEPLLPAERAEFYYNLYGPSVSYFNFPPVYFGTGGILSAYMHDTQNLIGKFQDDADFFLEGNPSATPLELVSYISERVYDAAQGGPLFGLEKISHFFGLDDIRFSKETVFNKRFPGLGDFFYNGNLDFGTPAVLAHVLRENKKLQGYGIYIGRFDFITEKHMSSKGELYEAGEELKTYYKTVIQSPDNQRFVINLFGDQIVITPFEDYTKPSLSANVKHSCDTYPMVKRTTLLGYELENIYSSDFIGPPEL